MTSEVARARGAAHAVAVDRADQSALPRLFPALLLLLKIALMVSLFAPIETLLLYVFYIHSFTSNVLETAQPAGGNISHFLLPPYHSYLTIKFTRGSPFCCSNCSVAYPSPTHILLNCLNEILIASTSAISSMSNALLSVPLCCCSISVCARRYASNARYLATHYNDQFLWFLDHMTICRSGSLA